MNETELTIGSIYRHKSPGGLLYQIENIILDASGYEKERPVTEKVLYTQLEDGEFPQGTLWVRDRFDFLENFKEVDS